MSDRPPFDHELDVADPDGYDEEYDRYDDEYEDDYVELRERSPRGRRLLTVVVGVLAVMVLALGALGLWVQKQIDPSGPPG
jgi:hypothetical protein